MDSDKLVHNYLASINTHLDSLCSLIDANQSTSQQAVELAGKITKELQFTLEKIKLITQTASRFGITKLAPTIHGKMEQIIKWLTNPYLNVGSEVGEQVITNIYYLSSLFVFIIYIIC